MGLFKVDGNFEVGLVSIWTNIIFLNSNKHVSKSKNKFHVEFQMYNVFIKEIQLEAGVGQIMTKTFMA